MQLKTTPTPFRSCCQGDCEIFYAGIGPTSASWFAVFLCSFALPVLGLLSALLRPLLSSLLCSLLCSALCSLLRSATVAPNPDAVVLQSPGLGPASLGFPSRGGGGFRPLSEHMCEMALQRGPADKGGAGGSQLPRSPLPSFPLPLRSET